VGGCKFYITFSRLLNLHSLQVQELKFSPLCGAATKSKLLLAWSSIELNFLDPATGSELPPASTAQHFIAALSSDYAEFPSSCNTSSKCSPLRAQPPLNLNFLDLAAKFEFPTSAKAQSIFSPLRRAATKT